jgi:hypothetical protein
MRTRLAIPLTVLAAAALAPAAWGQTPHGIATAMPAYYDSKLFTINFTELSPTAEATVLAQNASINIIYQSDPGLPGGAPFISVIDAITGEGAGFNPLWREVQITFTAGHTPRQITSDDLVLAAAASGEITLSPTSEVYTCSVIGQRPISASASTASASAALPSGGLPRAASATGTAPFSPMSWGQIKALFAH